MVWSLHDFEREVRRQVIEIESIRKRVPKSDDLADRLDRLEESQHYIMRKLREALAGADSDTAFDGRVFDAHEGDDGDGETAGDMDEDPLGRSHSGVSSEGFNAVSSWAASLIDQLREIADECSSSGAAAPLEAAPLEAAARGGVSGPIAAQVVVIEQKSPEFPDVNECCSSCGKLLLSGMLAGQGVTRNEAGWHHRACLDASHGDGGESLLN